MVISTVLAADKLYVFPFHRWGRPKYLTCQIMVVHRQIQSFVGHSWRQNSSARFVCQRLVGSYSAMEQPKTLVSHLLNSFAMTYFFWLVLTHQPFSIFLSSISFVGPCDRPSIHLFRWTPYIMLAFDFNIRTFLRAIEVSQNSIRRELHLQHRYY